EIENDVGRVLDHAGNRRELVQHAFDLDRGDRGALDRGEAHAPERVADRRAEAALERLRIKPSEPVGERLTLDFEPLGALKNFPEHRAVLSSPPPLERGTDSLTGPQTGLQTCK